jgi:hypothetical protein
LRRENQDSILAKEKGPLRKRLDHALERIARGVDFVVT